MALGRRVLIRNAALLAAAGGCARRIPASADVNAELDALGQIHLPASAAPQLQRAGGSVAVHLKSGGSETGFGVLLANLGSGLVAFDRDCPHEGCELSWVPEDRQVECPCHGSRFSSDGVVLNPPATTDIATYPVSVDAAGDFTVHFFPSDGTYPVPGADRKLKLDLAAYPQLAQVHGAVFGYVEGPPGALIVQRVSATGYVAVDATCTHRFCKVRPKADGVLHCPCHESEFKSDGSLMNPPVGPATLPLRNYPVVASASQLVIDLS